MAVEPGAATKLADLRDRIEKDPKSRMFVQLAEEFRRASQLGEAIATVRRGLEHHPAYVAAWNLLGKLYVESGRDLDARPVFERALSMDPQNLVAARLLGDLHYRGGALVEAIKRYKLVRAISPGDEALEQVISELETKLGPPPAAATPSPVSQAAVDVEAPIPTEASQALPADGGGEASGERTAEGGTGEAAADGGDLAAQATNTEEVPPREDMSVSAASTAGADESASHAVEPAASNEELSPFDDSGAPVGDSGVSVPDPDSSDFWRESAPAADVVPGGAEASPAAATDAPAQQSAVAEAEDFPFDIEPPVEESVEPTSSPESEPPAGEPAVGEVSALPIRADARRVSTGELPETGSEGPAPDREAVIQALRRWLAVIKKA